MDELSDAEIDRALEAGRIAHEVEPRAASASYDERARRVIVELVSGCTFMFPAVLAQGLELASDEQLAEVEVLGSGYGLHWETLDVDLSIPGLLAGHFGTASYMAQDAGRTGARGDGSIVQPSRRSA